MSEVQQEIETLATEHLVPQDTTDLKNGKYSKGALHFASTNKANSKSSSKTQLYRLIFEFWLSGHNNLLCSLSMVGFWKFFFGFLILFFFPMAAFAWQWQTIYGCDWLCSLQSLKCLLSGFLPKKKKSSYLMD